jgi:hypothetical protein
MIKLAEVLTKQTTELNIALCGLRNIKNPKEIEKDASGQPS